VVTTGVGKVGVALVVKAFAIGATSGVLVAGGYTALDASRRNATAERATASETPDLAPPSAAGARSKVLKGLANAETSAPNRSPATLPPAATARDDDVSPLRAPGGTVVSGAATEGASVARSGAPATSTGSFATWPVPTPAGSSSEPKASQLGEEAQTLKRARDALRAGDLGAASAALEAARTRFPHGALGEEREALTIQLLERSGQRAAARARAESFLRSFPNSAHAPRVRDIAGSLSPSRRQN
jgi:hypothetical protein